MTRLMFLTVCVSLCLVSVASARRSPTPEESTAIAAGFNSDPASCFQIYVSTVDELWASLTYDETPGESAGEFIERCPLASNGLAMMHRQDDGAWAYPVDAGSDISYCPLPPVPTAVALDLRACRKPGRTLIQRGTSYVYRPRRLVQGAHGTYEHLRWTHWGRSSATATGALEYKDAYESFTAHVRVSVSRIQECLGHRVYSRLHIEGRSKADRRKMGGLARSTIDIVCQ